MEALLLGISFWMLRFSFLTTTGSVFGWRCLWVDDGRVHRPIHTDQTPRYQAFLQQSSLPDQGEPVPLPYQSLNL